jgi:glycosyltransferase involved in cell wall biosynthesis
MVGIVPERKRFDRAVDLLIELQRRGHNAELHIKGPRPETLQFMRGASRKAELDYYKQVYEKIESSPAISGAVHFSPWGNDVSSWYSKIDHILSCSDFESFHYALADGVLAGCHPLVWPWEEAERIYTAEWIVEGTASAADRIEAFHYLNHQDKLHLLRRNRDIVEQRYGHQHIFRILKEVIGLKNENRTSGELGTQ